MKTNSIYEYSKKNNLWIIDMLNIKIMSRKVYLFYLKNFITSFSIKYFIIFLSKYKLKNYP